jgi:hypothetical protein
VAPETIDNTDPPDIFIASFIQAPVVLVVSVDLEVVAAVDQNLDRIGLVSGASVYPLAWNILLAARNEGYGGTLTSMAIPQEAQVRQLLGLPDTHALAALSRRRNRHPRTLRRCTFHPPNTRPMTPRRLTGCRGQPAAPEDKPRRQLLKAVEMIARRRAKASAAWVRVWPSARLRS